MGFRFRKSISLGKGLRINIGKKGVSSITIGKRGKPHVTLGGNGVNVGASIPGTGVSFQHRFRGGRRKPAHADAPVEETTRMPAVASSAGEQTAILPPQVSSPEGNGHEPPSSGMPVVAMIL